MKDSSYEERKKTDADLLRQLAVADIKEWFESLPPEKKETRSFIMGFQSYSPEELVREVENGTETGLKFIQMIHNVRIELAKGKYHA